MSANTSDECDVLKPLESCASAFGDSVAGRSCRNAANHIRAQSAELASLRARCDAAEKALKRVTPYAYHYGACGLRTGLGFECSCGMDWAKKEAERITAERAKEGEARK